MGKPLETHLSCHREIPPQKFRALDSTRALELVLRIIAFVRYIVYPFASRQSIVVTSRTRSIMQWWTGTFPHPYFKFCYTGTLGISLWHTARTIGYNPHKAVDIGNVLYIIYTHIQIWFWKFSMRIIERVICLCMYWGHWLNHFDKNKIIGS